MSRIDNIKAYKERTEEEKIKMEKDKADKKSALVDKVKALQPRIKELIDTANACLENGIEINKSHKEFGQYYDKWEHGTFCTNGITHKIGFVWQFKDNKFINKIEEMGIDGGGANGAYYLRTDGNYVISRIDRGYNDKFGELDTYQLRRFVETFDDFESAFYNYIDKIVGK